MYISKIPTLITKLLSGVEWKGSLTDPPSVYLTFDDGPHEKITPWVLNQLAEYEAKATFFCIGDNVVKHPEIFDLIKSMGHQVGNHTQNHLKGLQTKNEVYLENVAIAAMHIESKLFRPPYGKLKPSQVKALKSKGYRVIMYNLIAGDWDKEITPQTCLENLIFNLEPGDIVVLHDSEKAWDRMSFVLPKFLEHCKLQGWQLKTL